MLPRSERLRSPAQFRDTYRRGRYHASPLAVLHVGQGEGPTLAGFVASKKVGKAAVRNLAKRRLREAYRLLRHRVAPGKHLVWVLRPAAASSTYQELAATVERLLREAGLVSDEGEAPSRGREAVGAGA